jgi:gas vesicle protein
MKSGNVFLGVLAGMAIGAALGILFAPDKGSVTRNQIAMRGDEMAEDVKDRFNNIVENFLRRIENTLRNVQRETERAETEVKVEGL